jgi:predicted lipoprotein with Yx(FWY)xxD motif
MKGMRGVPGLGVVALAAVVFAAAGCGGSSGSQTTTSGATSTQGTGTFVTVMTRTVKGLGTVLVDSQGRTLYAFAPDQQKRVTCTATCAAVWPPLKLAGGQSPAAGGAARQSLLGTDADPSGGQVVTYAQWPLYTYVADTKPGQAQGQALNLNGGYWYVLSPAGQLIKTAPKSSSSSGSGY